MLTQIAISESNVLIFENSIPGAGKTTRKE